MSDDFYTLMNKRDSTNYSSNLRNLSDNGYIFAFNTEEEAKNFVNTCKTKFFRSRLINVKFDRNMTSSELKSLPWLDWSRAYTDTDLVKMYNVSNELWNFIDKFIPDYYQDYKEISK